MENNNEIGSALFLIRRLGDIDCHDELGTTEIMVSEVSHLAEFHPLLITKQNALDNIFSHKLNGKFFERMTMLDNSPSPHRTNSTKATIDTT